MHAHHIGPHVTTDAEGARELHATPAPISTAPALVPAAAPTPRAIVPATQHGSLCADAAACIVLSLAGLAQQAHVGVGAVVGAPGQCKALILRPAGSSGQASAEQSSTCCACKLVQAAAQVSSQGLEPCGFQ